MALGYKSVSNTAALDQRLTGISLQYRNPSANYIYDKGVLTPIVTSLTTGKIVRYNEEQLKTMSTVVADGQRGGILHKSLDSDLTYDLNFYKVATYVTTNEVDNAQAMSSPLKPFDDATAFVTDKIMLDQERACASVFTNLSADVTLSGTSQWSDYDNSKPIEDIRKGLVTLISKGTPANIAVIPAHVWATLRYHPDLMATLPNNSLSLMTPEYFASLFGLEKVFIPSNIYDASLLGAAASKTLIWGKNFWLAHVPASQSLLMKTLGFYVTKPTSRKVMREYDAMAGSTTIQAEDASDFVIVDTDCGYKIASVIA